MPQVPGGARAQWLDARAQELLPVPYFHVVFISEIQLRIGPLAAKLNKKELDAVRQHMKVEGENIKRMLEAQSETSAEAHGAGADV